MKTIMRLFLLLCVLFMASQPVLAQNDGDTRNKAVITTEDGDRQLNTDDISVIRFDGPTVTVVQPWGETVFDRTLRNLTFLRPLPGTLRLTVNLNTDEDSGSTRGHGLNGDGALLSTWSSTDRVYVYADATTTTSIGTLTPASTGGKVSKMTGDITATNLTTGQTLYLSTQPRATHSFATQTGDVTAAAMFYLTAESTVTINGGNATTADATFSLAQAILRVTLQDGSSNAVSAKSLVITDGTETITVTPTSATNILYVAMPAKASTEYTFTATDNDNREWTGTKTTALSNGYYSTTITLTKTKLTPTVTAPTALTPTYTGSAQALVTAGSTTGGTLYYMATTTNSAPAGNDAGWSTAIPTGTDATTYYVWTKVTGNEDYNDVDVSATSVTVTISKADASLTCDNTALSFAAGDAANSTKTKTSVSCAGGTISVQSSNTSNCTVSYSNGTITVTRVSTAAFENTVITVSVTPDGNHTSPTNVTFNVSAAAFLPAGALAGKFSVSNNKQVYFSKGNLQAVFASVGSTCTWKFADNQWDYVGNAAANTSINGNGSVSAVGTVDLFGWVGASSTWTGAAQYGISNSTTTNSTSTYGNVATEALKSDWGNLAITNGGNTANSGWRTLTKDEWTYLFNTRTVNDGTGSGKSYTLGQSVEGKLGVVIYPDGYTGSVYAGNDWSTFEAAGCVFLPAAGSWRGSSVDDAGSYGGYWSSSPFASDADGAYGVYFNSVVLDPAYRSYRYDGHSVRLVRQVE